MNVICLGQGRNLLAGSEFNSAQRVLNCLSKRAHRLAKKEGYQKSHPVQALCQLRVQEKLGLVRELYAPCRKKGGKVDFNKIRKNIQNERVILMILL